MFLASLKWGLLMVAPGIPFLSAQRANTNKLPADASLYLPPGFQRSSELLKWTLPRNWGETDLFINLLSCWHEMLPSFLHTHTRTHTHTRVLCHMVTPTKNHITQNQQGRKPARAGTWHIAQTDGSQSRWARLILEIRGCLSDGQGRKVSSPVLFYEHRFSSIITSRCTINTQVFKGLWSAGCPYLSFCDIQGDF